MRLRRSDDNGVLCWLAMRAGQFWDFVDKRQIDAYAVSAIILIGTIRITEWAMLFVEKHPEKSGIEVAAIIGALMVPWSALQGAAIKWLFDARQRSFEAKP